MSNNKEKSNTEGEEEQQQNGHQGMASKDLKNINDYFDELNHAHDEDKLNKAINVAMEEKKKNKALVNDKKQDVKINKDDVDVMNEMDISKDDAEKYLQQNNGDLEATLKYLIEN
ncbi:hypothetical protein BCR36DRAFT_90670 [Piromyces finnis]|uniref:UBA domain-containing protein n=1 Tax=Piromyces finnis TaxID=1754191 RepID=A0A1Y1VLG2_9FUNG|nr:hypothetical protein BCR36DRAFT_90670 [Piromyces finnis]|eukprot:ORX59301.1 hypothetical protein BCR36DRAFT_90670 [Piromyces finnis]